MNALNPSILSHPQTPKWSMWWQRIGIVFLMLVPLGLVMGTAATDIALTGVALMFVGHVLTRRDFAWLRTAWVPLALVIWVYYMAISIQAIEPFIAFEGGATFVRFVLFGIACQYWLLSHARIRKWMLFAVAIVSAVAAVDAWFQFFWGVDFFGHVARPGASLLHPVWPGERYTRLTAMSGKMKIGGCIIMMAWPALCHWLTLYGIARRSTWVRWGSLLLAFLVLAIIPLTGERTSTLWMVLGVLLTYLWVPQARKGLWTLILPFVLVVAMAFTAMPTLQQRMLGSIPKIIANASQNAISHQHQQNNIYTAMNRTALNLYRRHPIWGVGLKQFDKACQSASTDVAPMRLYRPNGGCNNSPQNMYLEFLVNTGTVGTVLFLSLMAMWAWRFWSHRQLLSRSVSSSYRAGESHQVICTTNPVLMGVFIALCLRVFPFVTTTSFYFSWGALTFWWMGAWLLAACDGHNTKA